LRILRADDKSIEWALRDARDNAYVRALLRSLLEPSSTCIDVGAHTGVFLRQFLEFAPQARHLAFEALPHLADGLKKSFPTVEVHAVALSDHTGTSEFQYLPDRPAWSGLRQQPYPNKAKVQPIRVPVRRLDDIVPADTRITFLKIDVEGAELEVLRGAEQTLRRDKPVVYFECGKIHHTHYSTTPDQVFDFLESCGLGTFLLDQTRLTKREFAADYESSFASGYDRNAWGNYLAMPLAKN
jgi:FkbM family methyltransferase